MKLGICHRLPERTFKIKGYYFPICSRCTGIYLGIILYLTLVSLVQIEFTFHMIIFSLILTLPTIIDGLTQIFYSRKSNNLIRFFTGLMAGLGIGIARYLLNYIGGIN